MIILNDIKNLIDAIFTIIDSNNCMISSPVAMVSPNSNTRVEGIFVSYPFDDDTNLMFVAFVSDDVGSFVCYLFSPNALLTNLFFNQSLEIGAQK
jgi:hypothetical protein